MKSIKEAALRLKTDSSHIEDAPKTFPTKAYGRVPLSVNSDKRLNGNDIRVYAGIAYFVRQGNVCRAVYSEIAKCSGVCRNVVWRSVKALIKHGHIEAAPMNSQRNRVWLILPSEVFAQKQRAGVKETAIGPSGARRLVSCPKRSA